jgi:hypothetical protein
MPGRRIFSYEGMKRNSVRLIRPTRADLARRNANSRVVPIAGSTDVAYIASEPIELDDADHHFTALQVAVHILGGDRASRLTARLRDRELLSNGALANDANRAGSTRRYRRVTAALADHLSTRLR